MTNRPDLDNELADMTDRLLNGQNVDVSPDNRTEALLVRRLYQAVSHNPVPDAAFRSRLTQRINQEWNSSHRASAPIGGRSMSRWAALAAVVVVAMGVMFILLSESSLVGNVQATAVGPASWIFPAIIIGGVVLIGFAVWRRRQ